MKGRRRTKEEEEEETEESDIIITIIITITPPSPSRSWSQQSVIISITSTWVALVGQHFTSAPNPLRSGTAGGNHGGALGSS